MKRLSLPVFGLKTASTSLSAAARLRVEVVVSAPPGIRIYRSTLPSVKPDVDQHTSFHGWLMGRCEQFADRTAFVCGVTGRQKKYSEVIRRVDVVASVLYHKAHVRRGSVVCFLSPNTLDFCSIFHAVLAIGGTVSPMNPTYTAEEIAKQLELSAASCLVTISAFEEAAKAALALLQQRGLGGRCSLLVADRETAHAGLVPSSEVGKDDASATVVLPFSSGTTGLPKGVQLTSRNLLSNVFQTQALCSFTQEDVMLSVLPFFHIYGLVVLLHGMMNVGAMQVIFPKFDMELYTRKLEEHRATCLFVAPPIMLGFAKHPAVQKVERSSVRTIMSGAAPLGTEIQRMVESVFPTAAVGQGYGLTETSPVLSISLDRAHTGSAGQPAPDTELRIVDLGAAQDGGDALCGVDAAAGAEGEVWARGPQVMKGYLRPEDTAKVMADGGWFRTGDIGRMDDSTGALYITDRLKELIKYKGYQIAPAELEAVLLTNPLVQDALVVGVPDAASAGCEVPRAHVVLRPGLHAEPSEIQHFVDSKVAPHKRLRGGIRIVPSVPKSPSGKLLRRVVKLQECPPK
jgi:4-coumarate--CoA ligase